MFTVTADNETLLTERHLTTAVLRALEASDERDSDVVLEGECAGLTMRGVYRRGARVEFECRDGEVDNDR